MKRFIAVRMAWSVLTVFLSTVLVFLLTAALPGDPARTILGTSATPERIDALNERLGLNQPLVEQYWDWLTGLVRGDLGTSVANGESVWSLIDGRLLNTFVLLGVVTLIAFPASFVLGALTAARESSIFDSVANVTALVVVALPEFVVAIAFIFLLAGGTSSILPAVSTLFPGETLFSQPKVLVLPTLAAVVVVIPYMMRMVRATVLEVLDSEYIEMARLSGLSGRRVLFRHALPNSLAPVTQVCALILVYLLGGLVVIETALAFPGIGSQLVAAVKARDLPQVQGIAVVLVTCAVLFYLAADVLTLVFSPRARTAL